MSVVEIIATLFVMTIPVIVVAFVFAYILTKPGHLFARYNDFITTHLPEWLANPLGGCYICFSGQLAFWLCPFIVFPSIGIHYNLFLHIYFVSQAILNIYILKYFYSKIDLETAINDEEKEEMMNEPEEIKKLREKK